jgi:nucleotide-binding universal stress UspA family protein
MFQRILLTWREDAPSDRALALARSLADVYGAELAVCSLGTVVQAAREAAGPEAAIEEIPTGHADRELLRYAHAHGFDLLVIARAHEGEQLPQRLIDRASLPVLVVA